MRGELYRLAQSLREDCGGRVVQRDNLHLTLMFLGNVAREKIPQLEALAARQRSAGFDFKFGATGYWRHNRIVWAAPLSTPETLHELVAALELALQQAGFKFNQRPYAPHLTLIRDAHAPATLPPFALDWPVRDFVLVESARGGQGPAYRVLARWALAEPGAASG